MPYSLSQRAHRFFRLHGLAPYYIGDLEVQRYIFTRGSLAPDRVAKATEREGGRENTNRLEEVAFSTWSSRDEFDAVNHAIGRRLLNQKKKLRSARRVLCIAKTRSGRG